MKLVFLGLSPLTILTARELIEDGHSVVVIEQDLERIEEQREHLDCGFLHGDGSKPDILKEVDPPGVDILFCVTDHDQSNIIAALTAKSLGARHVVTMLEDEEYLPVCKELGLENTLIPIRTVSRHLIGLVKQTRDEG